MPVIVGVGESKGITVPYPPEAGAGRVNHGFLDLRGRPELAAAVAEAVGSRALRQVLVRLAEAGAEWFSVGCDLGAYPQEAAPGKVLQVAGGYLQVMAADYARVDEAFYQAAAQRVKAAAEAAVGKDYWELKFAFKDVKFELDGFGRIVKSLDIWFSAFGLSEAAAVASRERLVRAVGKVF